MLKIHTIYFDFDGVLAISESGGRAAAIELAKAIEADEETIFLAFKELGRGFLLGENVDEFLKKFSEKIGCEVTKEMLACAYSGIRLNKPLFDLFPKLKETCSVELISNNSKFRFDILKERGILDIWKVFDKIHVSAILVDFKQNFVLKFKDKENSVLIDNNQKFLEDVSKTGMNVIYYDSMKHDVDYLIREFRRMEIDI